MAGEQSSSSSGSSGGAGCPVKEGQPSSAAASSSSLGGRLTGAVASLFGLRRTAGEQAQGDGSSGGGGGGCPVDHGKGAGATAAAAAAGPLNPLNNERLYPQAPQPSQRVKLSTERQVSSILKSDITPKHQPTGATKWVYPSEQQYFNAMKSKGFNPQERDVSIILAIHNAVNEQGWSKVLDWEQRYGDYAEGQRPRLKKFMGRPQDMSPKARLLWCMGYNAPFDRHDWVVERPDGTEVRYVLDFYAGQMDPQNPKPVAMHLDVRPALDSFDALQSRVDRQLDEWKASIFDPSPSAAPSAAAAGAAAAGAAGGAPAGAGSK